MENKLVSVIVPVYNGQQYIKRCVTSLLMQDYKTLEIIVVNDGSTDSTKNICEKLCREDGRIQLLSTENSGVSNARNIGISVAKGSYICFVDSDDYVERDFVSLLVENMEKNNVDISVCNYNYVVCNVLYPIKIAEKFQGLINRDTFFEGLISDSYRGFLWNKMFKTDQIKQDGKILKMENNITICEDLLFVVSLASKCNRFFVDTRPVYNYVQVKNSAYNSEFKKTRLTEIEAYNEILDIVEQNFPHLLLKYKEAYLKMALKINESYQCSGKKDTAAEKYIRYAIDRYYGELNLSKKISNLKKMYYAIYLKLPQMIHIIKIVYHKIRFRRKEIYK